MGARDLGDSRDSTLWLLAKAKYGGLIATANAIGVHPNTLYNAAYRVRVSEATRRKLEEAFELTLEDLQRPYREAIGVTQ